MDNSRPILTEPGVKYFLKETLKNCKIKKDNEFNQLMNLGLLTTFNNTKNPCTKRYITSYIG